MIKAIALSRFVTHHGARAANSVVVVACAAALIIAGRALPF